MGEGRTTTGDGTPTKGRDMTGDAMPKAKTKMDLPGWKLPADTYTHAMFSGCGNLASLHMPNV